MTHVLSARVCVFMVFSESAKGELSPSESVECRIEATGPCCRGVLKTGEAHHSPWVTTLLAGKKRGHYPVTSLCLCRMHLPLKTWPRCLLRTRRLSPLRLVSPGSPKALCGP